MILQKTRLYVCSLMAILGLNGCQTVKNAIPNAGPTLSQVKHNTIQSDMAEESSVEEQDSNYRLTIIDIDNKTVKRMSELSSTQRFSDFYSTNSPAVQEVIRAGDVVNVSLYEAPPALLFGATDTLSTGGAAEIKLPEQMVDSRGQLTIPFLGKLLVVGKTPHQVQDMIVNGLARKANKPSAIVGIGKNNSANITVVGEVNNSLRMPLTGKGERVLDAIAAAGGLKYPSSKVTVQLNRGSKSVEMPMDMLIKDIKQNIMLQSGDVLSVNYQSKSFTVLGATVKNDEISFESNGISLMQALARSGGLNDSRADSRGVFIFRYETPYMLTNNQMKQVPIDAIKNGQVPVVYRLNLKDPMNYIIAQNFTIKNNDVIYVSNAPSTEFSKFLNMISQSVYSIRAIRDL